MEQTAVIILSAGLSRRMETDKAFLQFSENQTFIEKIILTYLPLVEKVCVIFNRENFKVFEKKFPVLSKKIDIQINFPYINERFYSVKLGAECTYKYKYVFLQNVDNPSVSSNVLQILLQNREKGDVIIPKYENLGGHPVLINKKVLEKISREKDIGQNLKFFLKQFRIYYVQVNEKTILENINTVSEYQSFKNKQL